MDPKIGDELKSQIALLRQSIVLFQQFNAQGKPFLERLVFEQKGWGQDLSLEIEVFISLYLGTKTEITDVRASEAKMKLKSIESRLITNIIKVRNDQLLRKIIIGFAFSIFFLTFALLLPSQ